MNSVQDPNRYAWEGVAGWVEPTCGSRREWEKDRWRYLKMSLIPISIFGIGVFLGDSVGSKKWVVLGIASILLIAQSWYWTFIPRRIRLFKDRITIATLKARSFSGPSIDYADITKVNIEPDDQNWRITIATRKASNFTIYAQKRNEVELLQAMIEGNSNV
jgi:hypothetical protein